MDQENQDQEPRSRRTIIAFAKSTDISDCLAVYLCV